jgi:hypothetical protein
MTNQQTPPDWVLIEAARKCGASTTQDRDTYLNWYVGAPFRALCDMIRKYEQPPVDRKLLCAREAWARYEPNNGVTMSVSIAVRAIELYEEGFGRD